MCGGGGRIRTSEGCAGRFTVCSLWPLGNPTKLYVLEPAEGFEPPTNWLQISSSANWATLACHQSIHWQPWLKTSARCQCPAIRTIALHADDSYSRRIFYSHWTAFAEQRANHLKCNLTLINLKKTLVNFFLYIFSFFRPSGHRVSSILPIAVCTDFNPLTGKGFSSSQCHSMTVYSP